MSEGNDKNNFSELNSMAAEPDIAAQENLSNQTHEMVGYKKPPVHSRFKPGQSGNRTGRPKGAFTAKGLFRKVMTEMLTVTDKGRPRKLSATELVFIALRNKGMKGDLKAIQLWSELAVKWELDDQKSMGGVFRIQFIDQEEKEADAVKKYSDIKERS
jgi:Family of unknown function (DUF5681)